MRTTLLRAGAPCLRAFASTALTAPALAQPRRRRSSTRSIPTASTCSPATSSSRWSKARSARGEGALSLVRNWPAPPAGPTIGAAALYMRKRRKRRDRRRIRHLFGQRSRSPAATYTSTKANGATLTRPSTAMSTPPADGTEIDLRLERPGRGYLITGPACQRSPNGAAPSRSSIRRPNGMTYTLNWDLREVCLSSPAMSCDEGDHLRALPGRQPAAPIMPSRSTMRPTRPAAASRSRTGIVRTEAQFTNLDGAPASLPTVTYNAVSSTVTDVTDIGGQTWRLTNGGSGGRLTGIRRPGAGIGHRRRSAMLGRRRSAR